MKNKILIFLLFISTGAFAQNRMYNLTTQFDSVKVRKLLMTSILEGSSTDSVIVKKPNGGLFKVARSSFGGGGSGTVTNFSKVDGFGIISSVANPTTTPVLTIRTDTTAVRTVLNSYTKAQTDVRYIKASPFSGVQQVDNTLVVNGNLNVTSTTQTFGLKTLVSVISGAQTLSATQHTINCTGGPYTITLPTGLSNTGQQYVIKNNGTGIITLAVTGSDTIDGATTFAINIGESVSISSNYSAGWTKTSNYSIKPAMVRYTTSGDGSTTTIQFLHGMSGITSATPLIVQAKTAAAGGILYTGNDNTNIYVTYSVAPASGTGNLIYDVIYKP